MKKQRKSKGRLEKFERENKIIEFRKPEDAPGGAPDADEYNDEDFFEPFDADKFIEQSNEDFEARASQMYYREKEDGSEQEEDSAFEERARAREAERNLKKKKKIGRRKLRHRLIIGAILAVFLVFLIFSAHHIITLKMEQKALLEEQAELEKQKAELQEKIEKADDPEYIEQLAREQLHLIMPGEILYQFEKDPGGGQGEDSEDQ